MDKKGWLEIMGCGMVHPNVLIEAGVDPIKYSGRIKSSNSLDQIDDQNLSINKLSSFKFDALPAALIQLYCTDQQASALKSKPGSSLVDVLACSKGYNFLKLLADESILRGLSVFDDKDNSRTNFSCFGLKLF